MAKGDKQMNPLGNDGQMRFTTDDKRTTIQVDNMNKIMHQNLLFTHSESDWYNKFNRYGWIDLYNTDQICKEYLFFTKPDLFIFDTENYNNAYLNKSLMNIPFFEDAAVRHKRALAQLQYSVRDENGKRNPFMCILSNAVTGKMDLPGINADMQQATANIYGVSLDYRSNSIKSDYAFDFSLSFSDTAYLEIYTMVKAYDEYMRMQKMGEIHIDTDFNKREDKRKSMYETYKNYAIDRIIPEQFSVYKFIVGSDGETILYYAKATGVYFVDVPRSDFGDPGNGGFKYSLTFHANFIEDNNPLILSEFNMITPAAPRDFFSVSDKDGINNEWAKYPIITYATAANGDRRVNRRGVVKDYRLNWTNSRLDKSSTNAYKNNALLVMPNYSYSKQKSGGLTPQADPNLYGYNSNVKGNVYIPTTSNTKASNAGNIAGSAAGEMGSLRISVKNNDRASAKAVYVQ